MPEVQQHDFASFTFRKGCARIHINQLDFIDSETAPPLDEKNIARLVKVFDLEGCQREDPANFVPALISSEVLRRALALSSVTETNLVDPRELPLIVLASTDRATVLHGRHRLRAAQQHLSHDARWWTIELYDLGESLPIGASRPTLIRRLFRNASCSAAAYQGELFQRKSCQRWPDLSTYSHRPAEQLHK